MTLGSFAPIPSTSPRPSTMSGRSGNYATPPTSPGQGQQAYDAYGNLIDPSLSQLTTPVAPSSQAGAHGTHLASPSHDIMSGHTPAQPSFGSMMDVQPQHLIDPSTNAAVMYEQPGPGTAPAAGGVNLSRNPSTAYAATSLLNSPPVALQAGTASPPPVGYSSSTMMHDPSSTLHSRTGSQQALAMMGSPSSASGMVPVGVGAGPNGTGRGDGLGATPVGKGAGGGAAAGGGPGMVASGSGGARVNKHLIPSKNSGIFMAVILLEAVAVTTLVVIVFALIQSRIKIKVQYLKTVPVYLSIFVLGMVFEFIVALDAVRLKNTIQVVGVAIFNVALTVTAALEITQVRDAMERQDLDNGGIPCANNRARLCNAVDDFYYPTVQKFLVVVPILTGLAQIPITILTYYLFKDFGWAIYRKIGADLRIRNMFMWYQVFVVWLKFDFFFGGAFTIAYLIIVADKDDWEWPVTIAAVPAAFVFLFIAAFAVRREVHFLMWICIAGFFAGIVYFLYKLVSIFVPRTAYLYTTVRLTLPFFSIFAIVSLIFTLVNACICLRNFGKGLREAHDSFGTFGGLWTNRRHKRGGGLRESLSAGKRIGRSPSSGNQLNRFGPGGTGGYSEAGVDAKMSLNTSLDSSTGMKRVMNGSGGGGYGIVGEDDVGVAGGGPGMYEMQAGVGAPAQPRKPRISID